MSGDPAPLRIGLFSPTIPASGVANGIVTYVRAMRDALRAQGHRVAVIAYDRFEDGDGEIHAQPSIHDLGYRLNLLRGRLRPALRDIVATTPAIVSAVRNVHRREELDVVEIEESYGWARHLCGLGPSVVMRLHGPHVYGRDTEETADERARGDARARMEGKALATVGAISAPSARLLEATLDHYRVRPPLAEAIPNPIAAAPPERCWRPGDCDPDQILCVGRFDARKGADIVLQAFQSAWERQPSLKLVMAGPDPGLPAADGSRLHFADYVRAHIRPEAAASIRFLGSVSAEEIAALRLRSAYAVVGSRFENFPYSVAEAMAVGTASIVSDSFGNGEMVIDGETGLVTPVGDAGAMARAMLRLHDSPQALAAMAEAAWRRCRDWLAPERIAAETVALYRRAGA